MPVCERPKGCPDKPGCGMLHDKCPWAVEQQKKAERKAQEKTNEPRWLGDLGL